MERRCWRDLLIETLVDGDILVDGDTLLLERDLIETDWLLERLVDRDTC